MTLPFDFSSVIGSLGDTFRGMGFAAPTDPFHGAGMGAQSPFSGGGQAAQNPFQGSQWRIADPFQGGQFGGGGGIGGTNFGVTNPFAGNAFNVRNPYTVPSANSGDTATTGQTVSDVSNGSGDPNTAKWRPQIDTAAKQYGIDPDVVQAIMMIESGGDPNSKSQAGALGLMQVMPFWFKNGENGLDPQTNINRGAQILADNYKRYGNWDSAVAAYLGAVDANGNPTHAQDANGTDGFKYIQMFHANLDQLKAQAATSGGGDLDQLANGGAQWASKARTVLGVAYTNGGIRQTGDPKSGMDCSSFAGWALGIDRNLWNAQAEYDASQKISGDMASAMAQAKPGDLIFFQGTTSDDSSARPVTHVGIYIGGGKMVHTGGSPGVQVVDLNSDYWRQHYYGMGRLGNA